MKKVWWFLAHVLAFVVSFCLAIVVTVSWPSDLVGLGEVEWNDSVGKIWIDLPYAEGELNKFDLYVPADSSKDSYKLVVYIHAGGFRGGDKSEDAKTAKFFVSKGYVAATINYTVHTDEAPSDVHRMSLDIQQGIAAIVEESARRGYKLSEMAVAGGSAGGSLAMIYAYRDSPSAPVPVKFVLSMVGSASFDPALWFGFDENYTSDEEAAAGAGFVSFLTGDEVTPAMMRNGEYVENLKAISAAAQVTPDSPPTLVAYGVYDKLVPIALSKPLLQALEENDVPYDYIEFSNSGHGLNRDREKSKLLGKKIREYLDRYLPLDN